MEKGGREDEWGWINKLDQKRVKKDCGGDGGGDGKLFYGCSRDVR